MNYTCEMVLAATNLVVRPLIYHTFIMMTFYIVCFTRTKQSSIGITLVYYIYIGRLIFHDNNHTLIKLPHTFASIKRIIFISDK